MLLQPITVPFSKSTLKPSVYTLNIEIISDDNYDVDIKMDEITEALI